MRAARWLLLAALATAPRPGLAQGIALAPTAPGMAMTPPGAGMADTSPAAPVTGPVTPTRPMAEPPHLVDDRPGLRRTPAPDGTLPNQRTGPRRAHVVHDICIGC